jgi:predicted amidohydrolase YtcJ
MLLLSLLLQQSHHYRLEVHAIGDRAAVAVLDAFTAAGLTAQHRPIITHCQILDAALITRMAECGVVANIQPSFVPTDANCLRQRLSERVSSGSYGWRDMMQVTCRYCSLNFTYLTCGILPSLVK